MKKVIILNVVVFFLTPILFAETAIAVATPPETQSDAVKAATRLAHMKGLQDKMAAREKAVLLKRNLEKAQATPMTEQEKLAQRKMHMAAGQKKLEDLKKKVIAKRAVEEAQQKKKDRGIMSRLKKFFGSHGENKEDKNIMHKE